MAYLVAREIAEADAADQPDVELDRLELRDIDEAPPANDESLTCMQRNG